VSRAAPAFASVVCAGVVLASWSGGCGGSTGPTPPTSDATTGTITIGVIDSLTGGLSGLGVGMNQAVGVAAQQINRVGILGGHQVVFDVRDDTSDQGQSQIVAKQLLDEGVSGILGPLSSGEVEQVEGLAAAAHVVEISASATSVDLDQPGPDIYFFRTAPPDSEQAAAVVTYTTKGVPGLAPDAGADPEGGAGADAAAIDAAIDAGAPAKIGGNCKSAVIVNGANPYGTYLGMRVESQFPAGGILKRDEVPTVLQFDYSSEVHDIVSMQPDCLILIVYSDVGAEFLRELAATNSWSGTVCGTDGIYDANFIPDGRSDPENPASPNSTAGATGTAPDTAPGTPEYATFRDIWHASFPGEEPPPYGANQYDAAILLALAIQQAGTSTDGTAIRDALRVVASPPGAAFGPGQLVEALDAISKGQDIDYNGASGNCNFTDEGDVTTGYIVWQVAPSTAGYEFKTVAQIPAGAL
jgi:ABC-type branched-subunit amino acid transport system substrate-binding protein